MPKVIAASAPHRVILRRVSGSTVVTIPAIIKRTLGWELGDMMAVEVRLHSVTIVQASSDTDDPVKLRRISGTTVVTIPAIAKRTLGWKTGETMVVQMQERGVCIVAAEEAKPDR